VLNSAQARTALTAVKKQKPSGLRVHAFLAVMYFAALRPEEVVSLYVRDLTLPAEGGWGEITVSEPQPEIGKRWTDSGEMRDQRRQPKGRAVGEVRHVPCYPELTTILQTYIAARELNPNDKLFTGVRGGDLSGIVVRKAWSIARLEVFGENLTHPDGTTTRVVRVITGKKIYDLRHACLTGWLNSGVPAAQVAEWAGNSVPVLLATYAKCISGQEEDYKRRIEEGLKLQTTQPGEPPAAEPPADSGGDGTGRPTGPSDPSA
jgi:integrase